MARPVPPRRRPSVLYPSYQRAAPQPIQQPVFPLSSQVDMLVALLWIEEGAERALHHPYLHR